MVDYGWLKKVARDYRQVDSAIDRDDVAQEGAIAWWLSEQKGEGSVNFNKQAARWRMTSVIAEQRITGSPRAWGASGIAMPYDSDSAVWDRLPPALLAAAELAYHHAQIVAALKGLSKMQREYVWLRFWQGYDTPKLNAHFGYVTSPVWTIIKRKLSVQLEPLRELLV